MSSLLDAGVQNAFLKRLFPWYKRLGRHDMPWRKTSDPYAIFVSEYMLQQTTVQAVKPYYERFMGVFPTARALAAANLNDVLALWSGLGYYARARNLWSAMKAVVENHAGRIPSEPERLEKLPGVGPYTAGAVATLAFNRPAPVLDGNIIRVLMRVLALEDDPKLRAVQVLLRKTAGEMSVSTLKGRKRSRGAARGPRDLTLALMDLGATVCMPRTPRCGECPVARFCLAKFYGRQEEIPQRGARAETPMVRRLFAVIEEKGKWLMGLRPRDGLFGGLWEFAGVDAPGGIEPVPYLEEFVRRETGFPVRVLEAVTTFDHHLSHRHYVVRAFRARPACLEPTARRPAASAGRPDGRPDDAVKSLHYESFRWVTPAGLNKLGVSSLTRKIASALRAPR